MTLTPHLDRSMPHRGYALLVALLVMAVLLAASAVALQKLIGQRAQVKRDVRDALQRSHLMSGLSFAEAVIRDRIQQGAAWDVDSSAKDRVGDTPISFSAQARPAPAVLGFDVTVRAGNGGDAAPLVRCLQARPRLSSALWVLPRVEPDAGQGPSPWAHVIRRQTQSPLVCKVDAPAQGPLAFPPAACGERTVITVTSAQGTLLLTPRTAAGGPPRLITLQGVRKLVLQGNVDLGKGVLWLPDLADPLVAASQGAVGSVATRPKLQGAVVLPPGTGAHHAASFSQHMDITLDDAAVAEALAPTLPDCTPFPVELSPS